MAEHWMQAESRREKKAGTKGVFKRAAERAGMSTSAFAAKHEHDKGKLGNRARMAEAYMGAKH